MKKYSNILCFDKTTSIKTIRGMVKIKDIRPGDYIVSYDDELKDKCIDTVMYTAESIHGICAIVVFDNGTRLKATVDHPLMVITKGWCAVSIDGIEKMYGVNVRQLEIGDECFANIAENYRLHDLLRAFFKKRSEADGNKYYFKRYSEKYYDNLFSSMAFYNSCISNDIKPIISCELTYDNHSLLIIDIFSHKVYIDSF